jgi:hypothetical protein
MTDSIIIFIVPLSSIHCDFQHATRLHSVRYTLYVGRFPSGRRSSFRLFFFLEEHQAQDLVRPVPCLVPTVTYLLFR